MPAKNALTPSLNYTAIKESFLQTLRKNAQGEKTNLAFLKVHFPKKPVVTSSDDRIVQAIVIGGTNYEVALIHMDKGIPTLLERHRDALPQLRTTDDLYALIKTTFNEKATALALNFAFPLEATIGSNGEVDGLLLKAGKTHLLQGLLGKQVGQEIKQFISKQYDRQIPVAVANDVICLIEEDGAIVVATGTNIGLRFVENGQEKDIDLESGSFNDFSAPVDLEIIDRQSNNPGQGRFEKMLSGKYLPIRFNILNELKNLHLPPVTKSEELSHLALDPKNPASELARELLEQSASLVASQLAALYEFKNRPEKMTFHAEGSVIRKAWKYEENLKKRLVTLGVPDGALTLIHHEDSSIQGALRLLTRHS